MAMYLGINKIDETELSVTYQFDSGIRGCEDIGVLEINKKTGDAKILQEMPGDTNNKLAGYAYRAIARHWQKGEYPDKTCWAG